MHQLEFYNRNLEYVVEPGVIEVKIGSSSDNIRLSGAFTITGKVANVENSKVFVTPVRVEDRG